MLSREGRLRNYSEIRIHSCEDLCKGPRLKYHLQIYLYKENKQANKKKSAGDMEKDLF